MVVSVFSTKLSIENDDNTYYFKSEDECNEFISSLKEYNEDIETTIDSDIVEVKKITNTEVLENKVEEYRLDREARDAAAAAEKARKEAAQRQASVSSRSSSVSRASVSAGSQHPLDSYTCMSSGYG